MEIVTRNDLPLLLNELGLAGIGVEVGTFKGEYSEVILDRCNLKCLYSVDSWQDLAGTKYAAKSRDHSYAEHMQNKREAVMRLQRFGDRSCVMHCFSAQAARLFDDGMVDFVYIDAHHAYESVREDIVLWWPRVKRGGVLAGHDYVDDCTWDMDLCGVQEFGVKTAVDEFVAAKGCELYVTPELPDDKDGRWKTWYIVKDRS